MITLFTIGFTKKSAEQFFELLKSNNVKKLVDVRISNGSQLAGFAKGKDLKYFLKQICGIDYIHITDFAPTKDLLDRWHKETVTWPEYTYEYTTMLKQREIIQNYGVKQFDGSCFLCSEETPDFCHRRLLTEYMKQNSVEEVRIVHVV
ncbi:MAG: DUF488 domain-containing protein [Bacteroidaceae bacterium]|nr:DUF488 domain-containing protein [Bacteroidaceae bacterium]